MQYMLADQETGAHTHNLKNTWWQIKRNLVLYALTELIFYIVY